MQVVGRFALGADFLALIESYYRAPADHELFATIVNDLYEMFLHQGRLAMTPVESPTAGRAFYFLRAFFQGLPRPSGQTH